MLLSAVQAVGSAARLREIREVAYACVHRFRHRNPAQSSAHDRRTAVEDITDGLNQLELELSYSVEVGSDIGTLVPALRVESFHQELFGTMGLTRRSRPAHTLAPLNCKQRRELRPPRHALRS
ncbi:hypothetical protein [Streptomyces tubercidicus]